jgi:hypothetical protein
MNADARRWYAAGWEVGARHRLRVYRAQYAWGARFREKSYEDAFWHELRKVGLGVVRQSGLTVTYDGIVGSVSILSTR